MASDKYNIVCLMADQWRDDHVGPMSAARTPNLDSLAREASAVRFTNAYSICPLCTPARASLLTGKLPHQVGLTDNVQGRSYQPFGKLPPRERTYLERLRQAGYGVHYAGKWHLGEGTLLERGITSVACSDGGQGKPDADPGRLATDHPAKPPFYRVFENGFRTPDEIMTEAARAQLRTAAGSRARFALFWSAWGPHFPHDLARADFEAEPELPHDFTPKNFSAPFSELGKPAAQSRHYWPCQDTRGLTKDDWRHTTRAYRAYCNHLDTLIGRILVDLDTLGLAENTVVAVFADHGEMLGAHGNFDKGPYFYDEAIRIPLIIRAPDATSLDTEAMFSLRNLFPTLLSLSGNEDLLTDDERRRLGEADQDAAFITYDAYQGRQFRFRCLRTATQKYAWSPHDIAELYDLIADPGERKNLAGRAEYRTTEERLQAKLFAWMELEGDYLLGGKWPPELGSYPDGRAASEQHDHGW